MKQFATGFWKKVEVLDGSLVNWLGGGVIGEDWVGRNVLTQKFKQSAIVGERKAQSVLKKPNTTVVKRRAGT